MKKGLNRNQLKYIAIITMIIDHIGAFFIPVENPFYSICRTIGKLTAPTMCYFLVEGYTHTSSKVKYGKRLLIFAIISQFAFSLAIYNKLFTFSFNMIFSLFICFLILLSYEKIENKFIRYTVILSLMILSLFCDWGIFAPLWTLVMYIWRDKKLTQIYSYCCISGIVIIIKYIMYYFVYGYYLNSVVYYLGLILFVPVRYLYNGEKGKNNQFNKWFFYIFYPLHFLVIFIIRTLL